MRVVYFQVYKGTLKLLNNYFCEKLKYSWIYQGSLKSSQNHVQFIPNAITNPPEMICSSWVIQLKLDVYSSEVNSFKNDWTIFNKSFTNRLLKRGFKA